MKMKSIKIGVMILVLFVGFLTFDVSADTPKLWDRVIGETYEDYAMGVAVDSNNNIIAAGLSDSFGAGEDDVWVLKYNSSGTQLWNITRGGTSYDYANDVAVDSNNNIIVTGYYGLRRLTIKYNSSGSICGIERM